jgi:hypothetical protein
LGAGFLAGTLALAFVAVAFAAGLAVALALAGVLATFGSLTAAFVAFASLAAALAAGSGLARRRLSALRLARLAHRDAGLGGLGGSRLARRLRDLRARLDMGAAERGVHLAGQPRLASGGRVGMNGAGLGRAVERAQGCRQGLDRIARERSRGDLDGLADESLGDASTGLVDLGAAFGGADPLQGGRRPGAGPASGLGGQVGTSA